MADEIQDTATVPQATSHKPVKPQQSAEFLNSIRSKAMTRRKELALMKQVEKEQQAALLQQRIERAKAYAELKNNLPAVEPSVAEQPAPPAPVTAQQETSPAAELESVEALEKQLDDVRMSSKKTGGHKRKRNQMLEDSTSSDSSDDDEPPPKRRKYSSSRSELSAKQFYKELYKVQIENLKLQQALQQQALLLPGAAAQQQLLNSPIENKRNHTPLYDAVSLAKSNLVRTAAKDVLQNAYNAAFPLG